MKGLYRYLSPFSPDQSGAVAELFEFGGIIVILDAGGCAGNICGFDEPRWGTMPSAVYSAGIRDLDAILGRDERTVGKIGSAAEAVPNANFIALIGTPVPAVVGTDLKALARMCEKRFNLPTIAIETYGMEYYDKGAALSFMTLLKALEDSSLPCGEAEPGGIGVLGATPLDLLSLDGADRIRTLLEQEEEDDVYVFGMGSGYDELPHLFSVGRNIVISPAGLKPAKYLEKHYGIPYEVDYPLCAETCRRVFDAVPAGAKRILILHQQVLANALRDILRETGADVSAGTFFEQDPALCRDGDKKFKGEDEFIAFVKEGDFDVILGDPMYQMALKWWDGTFLSLPQYSVSGEAHELKLEKDLFA